MNERYCALLVILGAAAIAGCAADGDEPRPEVSAELGSVGSPLADHGGVVPPNSHAFGASYAEWSARWWQWALGLHNDSIFATGQCDNLSEGQSGHVLFIGGVFPTATLDCTISVGTPIFFPVVNVECSTLEPPPFFGANDADLVACADLFQYTDLSATIDGVSIPDLARFRVVSAPFAFTSSSDNSFGVPPGSGRSATSGIYLLLHPLSAGDHTISFAGAIPSLGFSIATTYHLHVGA